MVEPLKLRIVVPVYNAEEALVECINSIHNSLSKFNYWEILVVDNGKNKDLNEVLKNYPVKILVRKEKASAGYARNEGAVGFDEGILVFIDSDVIIEENCLKALVEPILGDECDATIGCYSKNVEGLNFAQKYKQLYVNHVYHRSDSEIKNYYWTAISAINAEVFHQLNGLDSNFKGANSEDQEFGIRLSKHGFKILPVICACGKHKHAYTIKKVILNDFRKGLTSIKNIRSNKVPLTDNRHSNKNDIIAVFMASLFVTVLFMSLFLNQLVWVAFILLLIWMSMRLKLISCYNESQGFFFCFKAVVLMFILELVRASCVMIYFLNQLFRKANLTSNNN